MIAVARCSTIVSLWLGFAVTQSAAQVVQLPSLHSFSYSGSVLVPDSGAGYLGGRNSSASSSRSRLGSRSISGQVGAAGASVHATIIDLDAMDREILGSDPEPLRHNPAIQRKTIASRTEEGKQLVRFARTRFRSGDTGTAFDAYRMAIEILPGELRELAMSEFRRVFPVISAQVASAGSR